MQTWTIRKPELSSNGGLVACQHYDAAKAGAAALAAGGNAIDAAVVAALVLSTAEPWLSGIGGGGFLVYAEGESGRIETLDFNVRSSRHLKPEDYPLCSGESGNWFDWPAVEGDRNVTGYSSICVPGAVAGLGEALARHGTLSWADALAPAIEAAERGLMVDWYAELCLAIDAPNLVADPVSAALFLGEGEPAADKRRHQPMPRKAETLRRLAKAGPRDFYEGETARLIVEDLKAGGSPIRADDLAAYQARWKTPASAAYRGRTIHTMAELSGGPSLLAAMAELAATLKAGSTPDADAALAYARAVRNAYQVRLNTLGHAAKGGDCTTHISVVDRHGNMAALTNTLLSRFGSKVTLPQAGFLMNNGMMWFDPRPDTPNCIAPDAQPLANMSPVVMTEHDRPVLAIGAAGGRQIFPTLLQLISYMVDYGMSLEEAFHHPRIDASTPTIRVNRRAAADVAARIADEYPVEVVDDTLYPVNFAVPSAVARDWMTETNRGMAHPTSPWSFVATERDDALSRG